MPVVFGPREEVWTYSARDGQREDERDRRRTTQQRTVNVLGRLADAVTATVADITFKNRTPWFALSQAFDRLSGVKLREVVESASVDDNTFDRRISELERVYGLTHLNKSKGFRPARALLLLTAECGLSPLIEGTLAATDSWPATTRLDLRGAFHLVSRWWTHAEPRILPRLAVGSLSVVDDSEPLPYPPLTRLYAGVLAHHRARDQIEKEAEELSRQTVAELHRAYEHRATKREIMQGLFAAAEDLRVIEPRPAFEIEPELRRRQELTRVILDLELGENKRIDTASLKLLGLIATEIEP